MADRRRPSLVAVVVCDSVGCGGAPDAADFGDDGANTLGHVVEATGIELPVMAGLGMERIQGVPDLGGPAPSPRASAVGRMFSRSPAKDTMVGHWELMGVIADQAFPTYPEGFPPSVMSAFHDAIGRESLGNRPASGTEILVELGEEHMATGKPIVYTSGDSVFQVAAHVETFGLERLYSACDLARAMLVGEHGVGRVIARPFSGDSAASFARVSAARRDYALPPVRPTVLDHLTAAGVRTHAIGKIHDIYSGRGLSSYEKTANNAEGLRATARALRERASPLVFTNLVDFDSQFGHRNDVPGYAEALVELDQGLPRLVDALPEDGLLLLTADHGNDPTWPGTDHTREAVPLVAVGSDLEATELGTRETFADLGATVLEAFGASGETAGTSFFPVMYGEANSA